MFTAIALAIPTGFALRHAFEIYQRTSIVPRRRITASDSITETLTSSDTLTTHVNPRNHAATRDSLIIDLNIPPHIPRPTDEACLAAFIRGFFGGKVIAPERVVLQAIRARLVHYPSKSR